MAVPGRLLSRVHGHGFMIGPGGEFGIDADRCLRVPVYGGLDAWGLGGP